jgi:iron complex transport system substrate-binding protein
MLGTAAIGGAAVYGSRHSLVAMNRRAPMEVDLGPFPKAIRSAGTTQVLAAPPHRIVSLTVATDEILTELVAPERLSAVSRFARDPVISTCANRVPIGTPEVIGLDPERLIALGPDVVFVAPYTQESALRILQGATIPVVRLRPVHAFEDVYANVRLVGAATGEERRADAMVEDAEARLRRVRARVAGRSTPRVLYLSGDDYTTGRGTLLDEKLRAAGGENAAATIGLVGDVSVSLDLLVALDPDVIVLARWTTDGETPLGALRSSPAWRDSRAVKNSNVHVVASSLLTAESQDAVLGVEALAAILHPEASAS